MIPQREVLARVEKQGKPPSQGVAARVLSFCKLSAIPSRVLTQVRTRVVQDVAGALGGCGGPGAARRLSRHVQSSQLAPFSPTPQLHGCSAPDSTAQSFLAHWQNKTYDARQDAVGQRG